MVWPFKSKTKPASALNYVSGQTWAEGAGLNLAPTPQAAENIAAVGAAVNAIAETLAALPAHVVRTDDPAAEPVDNHPLARLVRDGPNENQSWSDFLAGLLASVLLRGNGAARIGTNANGRLQSLTFLPWVEIMPWVNDAGVLNFDWTPMMPPNAGQRSTLLRSEVLFLADRSDNGFIGVPRLRRAAGAISGALNQQQAAVQFSLNSVRPSGILSAVQRVEEATAKRMLSDWEANFSSTKTGKAAFLSEGVTWAPLSQFSAEDLQIVSARNFTVADVSRIFAVPPFMLADPTRATYASAKEATRHFVMLTLMPWLTKLERSFSQTVLGDGYRLAFDTDGLTRGNLEDRWTAWGKARAAGVLSPNDVRSQEGWPAVPDGNDIAPPNTSAPQAEAEPAEGDAPPPPSAGNEDQPPPKPAKKSNGLAH